MKHSPEPKVLMLGRDDESMREIVEELRRVGRRIQPASTEAGVRQAVAAVDAIDIVTITADVPSQRREQLLELVAKVVPEACVYPADPDTHPRFMLRFLKSKIAMWKRSRVGT